MEGRGSAFAVLDKRVPCFDGVALNPARWFLGPNGGGLFMSTQEFSGSSRTERFGWCNARIAITQGPSRMAQAMPRGVRPLVHFLALVVFANGATGCGTLIGTIVGASNKKTAPLPEDPHDARTYTSAMNRTIIVRWPDGKATGKLEDVSSGALHLRTESGDTTVVPLPQVDSAALVTGTHAGEGLVAGLLIDLVVVGIVSAILVNSVAHQQ